MRKCIFILAALFAVGCASSQTAKQLRYIGYEETPTPQKSIGSIEGKDCSWHILGHSLGAPDVRNAFINAASQKSEGFIPGQSGDAKGAPLKSVRNVTVESGGFDVWVAGRSCVIVTAEGFR
jgi:hypothetical protein